MTDQTKTESFAERHQVIMTLLILMGVLIVIGVAMVGIVGWSDKPSTTNDFSTSNESPADTSIGAENTSESVVKSIPQNKIRESVLTLQQLHDNWDAYFRKSVTTRGVITNIVPINSTLRMFGNTIVIKDSGFVGSIQNIDDTTFKTLSLGDTVEVSGYIPGGGNSPVIIDIQNEVQNGDIIIVSKGSAPSPESFYGQIQNLIQLRQQDIINAVSRSKTAPSYKDCVQPADDIWNVACSMLKLGNKCSIPPQIYKDSVTLLVNAQEQIVSPCIDMFGIQ